MSKASEQMEAMTVAEIKANPCGYCWACKWEKKHDCYEGNPAQCSVCSLLLSLIEKFGKESAGQ